MFFVCSFQCSSWQWFQFEWKEEKVKKESEVRSQESKLVLYYILVQWKATSENVRKVFQITVYKENAKLDDMIKFQYAQTPQRHNIICSLEFVSSSFVALKYRAQIQNQQFTCTLNHESFNIQYVLSTYAIRNHEFSFYLKTFIVVNL